MRPSFSAFLLSKKTTPFSNITADAKPTSLVVGQFWLLIFSFVLSTVWLLPNHYLPWSTFHMDAWAALLLCGISLAVIVRSPSVASWNSMTLIAVVLVCLPALQFASQTIIFAGVAWINTAYLLGWLLALHVGNRWESASPGQLADALFLAIGIASIASVGLQLYQWFQLDGIDIWSMGQGQGRPYANFGQPNQLATFLLWGLVATCWAARRAYLSAGTTIFVAAYLLLGLAMSASRTAWLALALFTVMSWVWRKHCSARYMPWAVTGLGIYFLMCTSFLGDLGEVLKLPAVDPFDSSRMVAGIRTQIWSILLWATLERPLWGYGWGQVVEAQLLNGQNYPNLYSVFQQSHNLFLDLALWNGIPVALGVLLAMAHWFYKKIRAIDSAESALLMLFVLVPLNHAMFELPLHYAYVLLPVGLVMGAMDSVHNNQSALKASRSFLLGILLIAFVMLATVIKDYSRVERSYLQLRFNQVNPVAFAPPEVPAVVMLTQWREFIKLINFEPQATISDQEIDWMRKLTLLYPSAGFSQKLATGLAFQGKKSEAQIWLKRACKVNTASQCDALQSAWSRQSKQNQWVAQVPWPE